MNKRIKFWLMLFTSTHITYGQKIEVKDESSLKPISDIYIYHEQKENIIQTDINGQATLSSFPIGTLFLQHPSYQNQSVQFNGDDIIIMMKERIVSFNEVVVSANKWEQNQENISQEIISINKKEIDFQNPQTSADLLTSSGQVFVQKSQLGGGSPKLRGFAANGVLLVIDGVRMNNAIFRGGNLQNVINIDPNAIESTEVIFGPGSVIYGSDALGGVMDFHTVNPTWSGSGNEIKGNLLSRFSSAANEITGHIDLTVSKKKFTFYQSLTYTDLGDLQTGSKRSDRYEGEFERKFYVERINGEDQLVPNNDINLQKFSGYQLFNSISKLKFRISDDLDIGYNFYYSSTSNIPRYDNLTQTIGITDSLENAEWYYGPQNWMMNSINVNYYKSTRLFDQLRFTGAIQNFEESRNDRDFGDDRLRTRTENVDMYSFSIDADKQLGKNQLFYGFDFYHNIVNSNAFRKNIETNEISSTSTRYPDGGSTYTSSAIFISYIQNITNKFTVNIGTRYNNIALEANSLNENAINLGASTINLSNNALTGSLGLVYRSSEKHKFSYNVSTGFRAPNVDDVGKLFEINDEVTVVPNPGLNPEHTISNEIAYQYKSEKFIANTTFFYSRLNDAIVRGPLEINGSSTLPDGTAIRAQINAGEAEIFGASFFSQIEITRDFATTASVSFSEGKDLTNKQPLRHSIPLFGKYSLIYSKNKLRSECYIEFNGNRNPDDIPDAEFIDKSNLYTSSGSPGWYTVNLKSSYKINENLNINFGVENIFDQHYRPFTSGISAPGRNFIVAVRGSL